MRSFWKDCTGSIGLLVGLGLPLLAVSAAVATQYSQLVNRHSALQQAADSAALSAAQNMKLANVSAATVQSVAAATAMANLANVSDTISVSTQMSNNGNQVKVTLSDNVPLTWGKIIGKSSVSVNASATAQIYGPTGKLCLLALDVQQGDTLHVQNTAQITANNCVIYSNSKDHNGLHAENGTTMSAATICSVGGVNANGAKVNPIPVTDCPSMGDPLSSRPRPTVGSCTSTNMVVTGIQNLFPGVYCGGLTIKGSAVATLTPGVYVMNNGPLIVQDSATLIGVSAGVYFTGNEGGLRFDPNTTITMTAPLTGVMAGFIFFEDRTVSSPVPPPPGPNGSPPPPPYGSQPMRQYQISSNNASQFLGTFYLPADRRCEQAGFGASGLHDYCQPAAAADERQ